MLAGRALALARRGTGRLTEALERWSSPTPSARSSSASGTNTPSPSRTSHANTLHLLGRVDEATDEATLVHGSYREVFGARNPLPWPPRSTWPTCCAPAASTRRCASTVPASNRCWTRWGGITLSRWRRRSTSPRTTPGSGTRSGPWRSRRAVDLVKRVHHRPDHPDRIAAEANLTIDSAAAGGPAAVGIRSTGAAAAGRSCMARIIRSR